MLLTILGIILLVMAIFLTVVILMQHGKSKQLSGAIAGGADTFFGKNKGNTMDKMLSKITTIVAIVFTAVVIVVYIMQDTAVESYSFKEAINATADTTAVTDTVEDAAGEADTDAVVVDTAAAEETQAADTDAQ